MEEDLGKVHQLKKQDDLIDKDGNFKQRRIQKIMSMPDTNNNNSSGQEQSLETSVRIENSPGNGKDKVEEFKKLNKIFSDRVKRVNEKAEGSTANNDEAILNNLSANEINVIEESKHLL
ncbi:hypothetical protein RhiirA1_459348 [Rhizophagus irregularis]|uniref:Uncharacterized protein n=1 Tax=Rhizophagus irregularis TaxID=588596 RepID=A0A2I1EFV9_9GLOM|nr:hypothetical protein RhiirA1_459348 [Rhizophagus irregularis]PKY20980.1 hypothetical protein RhiirB3_434453 [Rhizophagus irregularis]